MPVFVITYELRGQGKRFDYNPFAAELRNQRCFQIQGTTWLGSFANNATQVHNHFKKLMEPTDSLLVNELYQHFAYTGHAKTIRKWLDLNPPSSLPGPGAAPGTVEAPQEAAADAPAAKKPAAKEKAK